MPEVIRSFGALQAHTGGFGPDQVTFAHGELAVDMIGHATAEELLIALRTMIGETNAKEVVGILLESGLTYDATIEDELGD